MVRDSKRVRDGVIKGFLAIAAAFLVRYALQPVLNEDAPLILFMLAVTISAATGGLVAGLLATLLSAGAGTFFLPEPAEGRAAQITGMLLFILVGAAISYTAEKLHEAARDAAAGERKVRELAEMLDLAHDAIMVRDANNQIQLWNAGAVEMYGWSPSEARSQNVHELLRTEFPYAEQQILLELHRDTRWEGELVRTGRNGQKLVVESRWVLARDEHGGTRAILEIDRDITGRKSAEEQIKKLYDSAQREIFKRQDVEAELRRSNEDLQQFAYVVSHDLQEPLRTAGSFADLLVKRHGTLLDPEAAEYLDLVRGSVSRMQKMIEDLLEYSRVAHGPSQAAQDVDMNEAWDWAVSNLQTAIADTNAVVTADNLPAVRGDFRSLGQLIQNLLSNAIRYRGRATPRIHFSARPKDGVWEFRLDDNGIGIASEHHERIFGVFKRLHGRDQPGTGIGLAICRKIVERNGGRIWVHSEPGKGSSFHFTLRSAAGNN